MKEQSDAPAASGFLRCDDCSVAMNEKPSFSGNTLRKLEAKRRDVYDLLSNGLREKRLCANGKVEMETC